MPEDSPLVSVIVATYNAASTFQDCLDSIASQTYPNTELIVMDGGSTDGTVDIIKRNDARIAYWESEPDRGVYHAWNKALERASGEWLCFVGADDYFWQEDVLEEMVPHLQEAAGSGVRIVYGRVALVSERGELVEVLGRPWGEVERRFRQDMPFPHTGMMHHGSLFEARGRFDESFEISADYELLLRELKSFRAVFVPDVISVGMRLGGMTNVPLNALLSIKEVARARRKNGITSPSPPLIWRRSRAFIRARIARVLGAGGSDRLIDLYRVLSGKRKKWTV